MKIKMEDAVLADHRCPAWARECKIDLSKSFYAGGDGKGMPMLTMFSESGTKIDINFETGREFCEFLEKVASAGTALFR